MTFGLFNQIAGAFLTVFGGSLLLPLVIVGFISLLILTLPGGKPIFVIVMIPLLTTIFTLAVSPFFQGMTADILWVPITIWLMAGLIVATIFWSFIR